MNNQSAYIHSLIGEQEGYFKELEQYAARNEVPIMERDSLDILLQYIRMLQPSRILEIGTAIGYSGASMLKAAEKATLVTIERDPERAVIAADTFTRMNMSGRITLLEGDALKLEDQAAERGPFDVLFIDAAKGQYERFFNLYAPYVNAGGTVFTDNVLFKGLVAEKGDHPNRNTRAMVKKIRAFNELMMSSPQWESVIVPAGDGLMISRKRSGGNDNEKT
ncbi:O-methyltransferase [Salisediminibacterium beveridgei]|uniref:tRNA 5-hydroxyuridine methyltransferase n=1 Tax=Salisediminibacterium beveridgei TaxID=632773 RepID=A0A1D7QU71_9BACI|nr:O-methyltransferase [Salisediminibacterium beveridgei]AOM82508.1 FIG011945: O-methyltransferase family protein [Salisediminibacterium beveridgei]